MDKIPIVIPEWKCKIRSEPCGCEHVCSVSKNRYRDIIDKKYEGIDNSAEHAMNEMLRIEGELLKIMHPRDVNEFMFILRSSIGVITMNPCENLIFGVQDYERKRKIMEHFSFILGWFAKFVHEYDKVLQADKMRGIVHAIIMKSKGRVLGNDVLEDILACFPEHH